MNKVCVHKDIVYHSKVEKDITLIHLADIHFSKLVSNKTLETVRDAIIKNALDYVLITGDLIDSVSIIQDKIRIKKLVAFLTDIAMYTKVILSLGNHDIFELEDYKFFKKLNELKNIYVLNNESYVDESIYISGFTLPINYYYNIDREESTEVLLSHLKKHKKLTMNLPTFLPKVALIHSPIRLTNKNVLTSLKEYDLLLSGHTHGGMVPGFLSPFLGKNQGIIAPNKRMFPKIARGRIDTYVGNKKITLIINGAITKLSERSGELLSKLNFVYNMDINKIIITNKKGRYYE